MSSTLLRAHAGEVHALCFIRVRSDDAHNNVVILSGATDGTIASWDAEFNTAYSPPWVAHSGGLLALRADETRSRGSFWSHGRDGCVHAWEWTTNVEETSIVGGDDDDDDSDNEGTRFLNDLLNVSSLSPPALHAPPPRAIKIFTFCVGFGGFCSLVTLMGGEGGGGRGKLEIQKSRVWPTRLADVAIAEEQYAGGLTEEERDTCSNNNGDNNTNVNIDSGSLFILAAPALDGAGIELWDGRRRERICIIRLPASAAAAAAAYLLKGTPAETAWSGGGGDDGNDGGDKNSGAAAVLARPGMPTCLALVYDDENDDKNTQRCIGQKEAAELQHSAAATPTATVNNSNVDILFLYQNSDGTPKHPCAPGGGGLRELLLNNTAYVAPVTPLLSIPNTSSILLPFPALIVAAYETGSLFLLAPPNTATHNNDDDEQASGAHIGTDALVLATLRISRHPLLALAVGPRGGIGVATAAGALAFIFSLNIKERIGTVLRSVRLPASGAASAAMGLRLGLRGEQNMLIGGWDGCARVIRGGKIELVEGEEGVGVGEKDDTIVWASDAGSISAVAVGDGGWAAAGDKGGRIKVWAPRERLWE